jgi:hypothetical protein
VEITAHHVLLHLHHAVSHGSVLRRHFGDDGRCRDKFVVA